MRECILYHTYRSQGRIFRAQFSPPSLSPSAALKTTQILGDSPPPVSHVTVGGGITDLRSELRASGLGNKCCYSLSPFKHVE